MTGLLSPRQAFADSDLPRFLSAWAPYLIMGAFLVCLTSLLLFILNRRLNDSIRLQEKETQLIRENLRQVMDLVPSIIYVKDGNGCFQLINKAMAESLGSTAEALIGKLHVDVHPEPEEAKRMHEDDLAVIRTRLPQASKEEPYHYADGSIHWLQSTRLPFTLFDSDKPAVLTLAVDITSLRHQEATIKTSEERFRAIFNQTYQFSSILDLNGNFLQVNETTLMAFEKKRGELLGTPFSEAPWWGDDRLMQDLLRNVVHRAARGEAIQDYIDNFLPDGSVIDVDFTLKPARNSEGQIVFLIAEWRDITRLKESEEKLRRLNEGLEQRVAERTRKLEEAKAELEDSLEELHRTQKELILSEKMAALGGLVAGVAHEINTPLGVGVTASSFLEERLKHLETAFNTEELKRSDLENFIQAGRESCTSILSNLGRAAELIKSFKQVAADQSSELPRSFNLRAYVDEVLVSLKPKFKPTNHVIENACPDIEFYSFPGAFMQILTNLLVNTLMHAYEEGEHGHIRIGGKRRGKKLFFTFSDDGKGIPHDKADKVFEPFYTTKRAQGGTGLGLHIVFNTVTQTLGGTIRMESEPGEGTRYTIVLPLKHEPE